MTNTAALAAARTLALGARVQFTHDGATVTGTLIGRGDVVRKTRETPRPATYTIDGGPDHVRAIVHSEIVDNVIDVKLNASEARRYPLSQVTDLVAAPLTGELPECAGFVGAGQRCGTCRTHRRVHA